MMNRQELLTEMRALEDLEYAGKLPERDYSRLEYLRVTLYPLAYSEMTDAELAQLHDGLDEPNPKFAVMPMHGKGTRRVNEVLSGRAIY